MIKPKKLLYISLFFINTMWLVIFLRMTPLADDWGYVTTPHGGLLSFARPMDELIGMLLKAFPFLFPWFNRVVLVVLHFINCIIFHKFAVNILKKERYLTVFTLLFSISPWVYAAIAQTDSINQVIMFTLGIIGTYLYFKTDNETRSNICYIVFTALSLCAKESGTAFLAITPAVILIKVIHDELNLKSAVKRMFRSYLWGIVLFATYFTVFFIIRTYVPFPSNPSLAQQIWKIIFPLVAFTGANTIDIFNGFRPNLIVCFVLSTPLLLYAFANFIGLAMTRNRTSLIALLLFIFGELFLLPMQLFYIITDMHIYPFVFFALLIILYFLPKNKRQLSNLLIALYFASSLISIAEKVYWQNVSSGYVREFQAEVSSLIGDNPDKIYTVYPNYALAEMAVAYHGIAENWVFANSYGLSLHAIYGYDIPIRASVYYSTDEIDSLIESSPDDYTILVVYPDKSMRVIKQE